MKLKELIEKIDKSSVDSGDMDELNIALCTNVECYSWADFSAGLKKYWVFPWMCTDTVVGVAAYFLHDEFVAISNQKSRSDTEEFFWKDAASRTATREFIISLENTFVEEPETLVWLDLESEVQIPDKIDYTTQIMHSHATYDGVEYPIQVTRGYPGAVHLKLSDGSLQKVSLSDLTFSAVLNDKRLQRA